jgi:hypothetical protein
MGKLNTVLGVNTDAIRIRSFTFNNQVLRVRVPTSSEAEQIFEKTKEPSAEIVEQKYQEIAKPLLEARDKLENSEFVFKDDDILVKDKSMRELAKTKASTELRIVETFKLLVAGDGGRMEDLTYEDVSQDLPLPIQLELVQRITEVISPNYEESRKNS